MASKRTYILAPNFQYKPNGPIQIGNIIADPFRPTKVLSTLTSPSSDAIETVTEREHTLSRTTGKSISTSVFAHFLSTVGGDVSASRDSGTTRSFTIRELETRYLREELGDDDTVLAGRLREKRVRGVIDSGMFGKQPVYIVTGVKIARGLTVKVEQRRTRGGGVGAEVPVTESISAGSSVKLEKSDELASEFKAVDEVVFAYQVHKIKVKGRGAKERVEVGVFEDDAAFLNDDVQTADEGVEVSVAEAGELAKEFEVALDVLEVEGEDEGAWLCLAARS